MTISVCHAEFLDAGPSVRAAISAVARERDPAVLDSADTAAHRGRYTILACNPVEVLATWPGDPDPFDALRLAIALGQSFCNGARAETGGPREDGSNSNLPFRCGWIGYFAYEAGQYIERIGRPGGPKRDIPLPVARWALYDSAAIYDNLTDRWTIVAADLRQSHSHASLPAARIAAWKRILVTAREPIIPPAPPAVEPIENMMRSDYLERVRSAKEYIAEGDIFQVNLARRFTLRQIEPVIATYLRLREQNPATYAAFLSWDEGRSAILSASPELFLAVRDRQVVTRPIKGTRPRSLDPIVDESLRAALLASEKDRAELAMIVDLERNDLGRVCDYGSIDVGAIGTAGESPPLPICLSPPLPRGGWGGSGGGHLTTHHSSLITHDFSFLESHPTVHHLVASITGRLRDECDLIDLLKATFPGGSITGAPKVRAMQIIDELEPVHRSVYTGAIGCIGLDGRMTLNIAIRTLIAAKGQMHAYVGSGIVADSDPDDEYAETTAKAAGLCRALGLAARSEQVALCDPASQES